MTKYIMLGMGYISGRHLDAIKNTGGELVAYHDIHDVVGHVDSRFINAKYYNDLFHMDCFVDRFQAADNIDYAVISLPNHLHNPACRWALNHGMNVIVEKPLVMHERNLDELLEVEARTGKKINTILQMRLHECTARIQSAIGLDSSVEIVYNTPRGPWFRDGSWKSDINKSGGIATAIGIHLFDLCCVLFGEHKSTNIYKMDKDLVFGANDHSAAVVRWRLSVEPDKMPNRSFIVNGVNYDFTTGFNDLHTKSYQEILAGRGFGIEDARPAIRITEAIRHACD